ncbi:hypothetical protein EVAR_73761_1 [Eumeta japonica]|uniref:Uncharacterized protein n=1 Tax=Eumeta variegata TaxID=151549 RepID=A0A4C1TAV0_EUMVA|nr:hypothetical protein EVAR_73761_1 [Eumeta japonica]
MAQTPQINSALETPLMFSRRSSMDSLAEEDVGPIDDKSSVVSEFSRLASGVISPSEIPDSPYTNHPSNSSSRFHPQPMQFPEGEEEEDANENNDDLLLASCINMGMNRTAMPSTYSQNTDTTSSINHATDMPNDEPRQYYTEDTPALLSKVGSNTNLSAISICSSINDHKENTIYEVLESSSNRAAHIHPNQCINRRSLNLSDDMSSNASESGAGGIDILQQCIRDGMQKPSSKDKVALPKHTMSSNLMDPIAMLRRGGQLLPPFVPVNDEMNKYRVEDSPCNFSVMSGLSNLTVGSSLVGPAVTLQETTNVT